MNMRFSGNDQKLLVAVSFDDLADGLVRTAQQLAEKSGMKLRLTHVSEPWKGRPWISTYPGENISYEVARVVEEKNLKEAADTLATKVKGWGLEYAETNVVSERVGHGLSADAVSNRASMILTATRSNKEGPLLRGFSTAMGLLAESNIPVLVVPEGAKLDFAKKPLRIMVCDDLEEGSLSAVHAAFEFAAAVGGAHVDHVHVNKVTKSEVESFVKYIQQAMNAGVVTPNDKFNVEAVLQDADSGIAAKMDERSKGYRLMAGAKGCKYEARVLHGDAKTSLEAGVKDANPDVIVFGRHETLHRKPMSIGKMPFHGMRSLNRAVMMVPSVTYLA